MVNSALIEGSERHKDGNWPVWDKQHCCEAKWTLCPCGGDVEHTFLFAKKNREFANFQKFPNLKNLDLSGKYVVGEH